ncbi:electron transport complex subunit RsxC [Marinilabilia rubra]|uniref:Ion-translocating oxidoreductase complex subunit C n=1 Tax=Marinilabilia rubra TaxID=2162893 RepID=A0A2U2B675_9BACT|nr:electron transport complex subunit RsxC [Marinilabilia rubra]PWD98567.1 electron transport complex subunit RsxC [Marinilabilia rubra]
MLKTFSIGGIHPADRKLSAGKSIEMLPLPKRVAVPIAQHIGAPAKPEVKKGDLVKTGQVIAKTGGFVSANIHSPVSGKIFKLDEVVDASGYRKPSIIIDVDGDEWDENIDRSETLNTDITLSSEDIIKKVGEMGIVGMGGATFPAHVKLSPPPGKKCDILIINGVECEPFLTSDHRVMLEKGDELIVGIRILMKALKVDKAVIGIENNKPDAIQHLKKLTSQKSGIEVQPLKVQYPQGGEKQLIDAVIGRQVPSGKLPIEVGAVVHNVGTAYAIYEAVQKNKPLVERVVTVTGPGVTKPGNFLARIGTPVSQLIEAAGGLPDNTGKVVGGGPMMGKALTNLDVPVTKGSSGILILPHEEAHRKPVENCIRCSKCISACPMGLEPYLLMIESEKELLDRAEDDNIMDCIECGSCSFTCPANRPLLDYIRLGKGKVGQIIRNRN